jgi:hypothetical protein
MKRGFNHYAHCIYCIIGTNCKTLMKLVQQMQFVQSA